MAELSQADIIQQYGNSVILYKGKPHKVKQVGAQIKLLDLQTQRNKLVDFSMKDFHSPVLRLGYVNCDENAVYMYRQPYRQYSTGLVNGNIGWLQNPGTCSPTEYNTVLEKLQNLECPEIADMMMGHYPSLQDASKKSRQFRCNVAFDRQFAVDYYSRVYYKARKVGVYNADSKKIEFNKEQEYLSLLIGNEYEKAARTFSQKAT